MNQLLYLVISQHINSSGPYEQNELSILVATPSCNGDPTSRSTSKFLIFLNGGRTYWL